jgi:NTP pyrophosphatase (non-canonical NTP hydrolase)
LTFETVRFLAEITIDDYAAWVSGIKGTRGSQSTEAAELSHPGLGLAGECGKVVELIKSLLRDGTLDAELLADELGDVAYYWARLCVAAGCNPSEILDRGRRKITDKIHGTTGSVPSRTVQCGKEPLQRRFDDARTLFRS